MARRFEPDLAVVCELRAEPVAFHQRMRDTPVGPRAARGSAQPAGEVNRPQSREGAGIFLQSSSCWGAGLSGIAGRMAADAVCRAGRLTVWGTGLNSSAHERIKIFPALVLVSLVAQAADWLRFRGPAQDGISRKTGLNAKALEAAERSSGRPTSGTGFSSITIAHGRAYTMGNANATDTISCLDASTGKRSGSILTRRSWPNLCEGGSNATPTVDSDRVFTFSKTGKKRAARCREGHGLFGEKIWRRILAQKKPEWGFSGSVLIEGDLCDLQRQRGGSRSEQKLARSCGNREQERRLFTGDRFLQPRQDRLAIFVAASDAIALNPKTGVVAWTHPWKTSYDINAATRLFPATKSLCHPATTTARRCLGGH